MNVTTIYLSSVAFHERNIHDIIAAATAQAFNLEFSSGLDFDPSMEEAFLSSDLKRLPHNYFPAPSAPFVLNLASKNHDLRLKSIQMCKNGLRLAKAANSPFYAAHAGFCIDPDPNFLGKQLLTVHEYDRAKHWQLFLSSIIEVLADAQTLNVPFLIENNVLAKFNTNEQLQNPLFCCEATEIIELFTTIQDPLFGLLLDTAHLKVSCETLSLNAENEMRDILPYIKAMHHSDNDGLTDSNDPFTDDYWCRNLLSALPNMPHVVEVKNINLQMKKKQIALLEKFLTYEY
ncbi:TIM barrel protein [Pedobacter sp. SD-b]|uniref:TIM barrel protein n=1 Tax=Pedobacter segetis TaxID=2793069 RepID=A0ABS1BGT5_9SPHI|nr:TIM barrel protein [Pedobacter segetis]MBK0382078.1 TIM barrel protein [Pedobacter segetis]